MQRCIGSGRSGIWGGLGQGISSREVANALIKEKGGLRKDIWDRGIETVGSEVLYSAIHLVGLYHHQAFVLNGFDIGYPEDEELLV